MAFEDSGVCDACIERAAKFVVRFLVFPDAHADWAALVVFAATSCSAASELIDFYAEFIDFIIDFAAFIADGFFDVRGDGFEFSGGGAPCFEVEGDAQLRGAVFENVADFAEDFDI